MRPTRSDSAVEAAHMLTGVEVSDTPAPPAPAPPAPRAPAKRAAAPSKAPAKRTTKAPAKGTTTKASRSGSKAPAQPEASGSGLRGR